MRTILEICVNSAVSAAAAQIGGADRVELCENMAEGGCTPSYGTIKMARAWLNIKLFVMIRPRGADFLYSDDEFRIMKEDVRKAKELGADGVVFGILKKDGTIDTERMGELVGLARPMGITCHRAFDMTRDPMEALETLISLGVDRVLTSGQADSALLGAKLIRELIARAGERMIIMPGHGIKEHNLAEALTCTGAREVHLYLPGTFPTGMDFHREDVKMGSPDLSEYSITRTDPDRVRMARRLCTTS